MQPINQLHRRYLNWRETEHGQAVFNLFERMSLRLASNGRSFSMNYVRERFREEIPFADRDDRGFKFCNTHSPYVARELIQKHPHLRDNIRIKTVYNEGEYNDDVQHLAVQHDLIPPTDDRPCTLGLANLRDG